MSQTISTTTLNFFILSKKRSTVDVVGHTSTSAFSFQSSCHPDVSSSSIISSALDVPDVTESKRHDLIKKVNADNNTTTSTAVTDNDVLREIMSMVDTKEIDHSTMMFLEGNVNSCKARILIDCGASHNFISEDFVKYHSLSTTSIERVSVSVANGIALYISQALTNFELTVDNFNDKISSAYVFPIKSGANYDLILGLPWLFNINPHIDWKTRIITIQTNNKQYVLKPNNSFKSTQNHIINATACSEHFLLNAKQLSRCKDVYLVVIKATSNCSNRYVNTNE